MKKFIIIALMVGLSGCKSKPMNFSEVVINQVKIRVETPDNGSLSIVTVAEGSEVRYGGNTIKTRNGMFFLNEKSIPDVKEGDLLVLHADGVLEKIK